MIRLSTPASHPADRRVRQRFAVRMAGVMAGCLLLAGCAGPPLRLYTLGMPSDREAPQPHLSPRASTIAIGHVVVPDYLDTQDILVRNGEEIHRNQSSRWASRLSIGITNLVTNEIASFHPSELITDQPLADAATMQIQINVSRFDVDSSGQVVLEANWSILPSDPNKPLIRDRAQIRDSGPVTTSADVAALMRGTVIKLADKINASLPSTLTSGH